MTELLWGISLFCIGYVAGIVVSRLLSQRIERRRVRRIAQRGGLLVSLRAPRAPQAIRRAAARGGAA